MDDIYFSGRVKRNHTVPTINEDLCASHSWGVARHIHFLLPEASKNLLLFALFHDGSERTFGDIPWPTKEKYPEIRQLDDEEAKRFLAENIPLGNEIAQLSKVESQIFKIADMLDYYDFCSMEVSMGNLIMVSRMNLAFKLLKRYVELLAELDTSLYEHCKTYINRQLREDAHTYG